MLEVEKVLFSRHGTKTKPAVSESSVTDIDTLWQYCARAHVRKHKSTCCFSRGWRLFCSPFPFFLNGSDRLARSQSHLWLRVHLFRITIPPLDLWLSLRSHFGRNDNEFEDKSWKNTLLWQLRFPWLIDKCNRVGAIKFVFFHRQGTRAAE